MDANARLVMRLERERLRPVPSLVEARRRIPPRPVDQAEAAEHYAALERAIKSA